MNSKVPHLITNLTLSCRSVYSTDSVRRGALVCVWQEALCFSVDTKAGRVAAIQFGRPSAALRIRDELGEANPPRFVYKP